jgi:hypothetical protein
LSFRIFGDGRSLLGSDPAAGSVAGEPGKDHDRARVPNANTSNWTRETPQLSSKSQGSPKSASSVPGKSTVQAPKTIQEVMSTVARVSPRLPPGTR